MYKLMNKNFILVLIGELISIFGNSALRCALSFYILFKTDSATIFGTILAVSTIPTILFAPFGGILADRVNRKNLMVCLDFITAVIIIACSFWLSLGHVVIVIAIMMVLFSIIESFYRPAVQSSIPILVRNDDIEKANSIVSLINALASMSGPAIGGIIYSKFGITSVLTIGAICFASSAVMELFIKMDFTPAKESGNAVSIIKNDLKESLTFITKEKPIMFKIMFVVSGMNLFLTSMFSVGLPIMISKNLSLPPELFGLAETIMAAGMIIGGILTGALSKKMSPQNSYILLFMASLGMLPIGVAFLLNIPNMIIYWILVISIMVIMAAITMFIILMNSFVQRETPNHLVGKVIAYILALCQFSIPLGRAAYGFIFDIFSNSVYAIILITAIISGIISLSARKDFKKL